MKNIFTTLLIIISTVQGFTQQATDTASLLRSNKDSAEFLMTRSNEQKTGAYVLGGIGLVTAGVAFAKIFTITAESTSGPLIALSIISITANVGAAALMITSKNTKAKAQSLLQETGPGNKDRSCHQPTIKNQESKTIIIAGAPFKSRSIKVLRKTSIGISRDKINLGYYSRPAKLNSLVLSVSLGN
jgi:hypothetical protein